MSGAFVPGNRRAQWLRSPDHAAGSELEPPAEQLVVRKELCELLVDARDVGGVAGERRPAKGPDPAAEERADVRRDEARVRERVLEAGVTRLAAEVVPVVEDVAADPRELEQALDVSGNRGPCAPQVLGRVARAERGREGARA